MQIDCETRKMKVFSPIKRDSSIFVKLVKRQSRHSKYKISEVKKTSNRFLDCEIAIKVCYFLNIDSIGTFKYRFSYTS